MKRKFLAMALAALMVIGLVGCGGSQEISEQEFVEETGYGFLYGSLEELISELESVEINKKDGDSAGTKNNFIETLEILDGTGDEFENEALNDKVKIYRYKITETLRLDIECIPDQDKITSVMICDSDITEGTLENIDSVILFETVAGFIAGTDASKITENLGAIMPMTLAETNATLAKNGNEYATNYSYYEEYSVGDIDFSFSASANLTRNSYGQGSYWFMIMKGM